MININVYGKPVTPCGLILANIDWNIILRQKFTQDDVDEIRFNADFSEFISVVLITLFMSSLTKKYPKNAMI